MSPGPAPDPEPPGPAPDPPPPEPFSSPDRADRERALSALLDHRLSAEEVERVGRLIVVDPDPEIRVLAVQALGRATGELPIRVVERGLQDPEDGVRAAMVRVAADRCPPAAPLIVRLAVRRRWPMAQFAALERIPVLLGGEPALAEVNLETLLSGVAAMEPPPMDSERPALAAIARSIGHDRLAGELLRPGPRRLGAARLLLMEGDPLSLRRLAELGDDPMEEIRLSAAAAANMLGAEPDPQADLAPEPKAEPAPQEPSDDELIEALAAALTDPHHEVRARSREAMAALRRTAVIDWVGRTLARANPRAAARAAATAEALHLLEAGGALLQRASVLPPEARGPHVGALDSLRLDPQALGDLVSTVDPAHRHEAVRVAWIVGGRHVLPRIRSLVHDSSAPVRRAALEVLVEGADPEAVGIAQQVLEEDASAPVRATAVRLLARAGGARRMAALERALVDPDPDVRATTVEALPRRLSAEASQVLLAALADEDERVWRAAVPHLTDLLDGDLPLLWSVFRQSPQPKREEIARAVERSHPERLVAMAESHATAPDWADRALAVEVAARAGSEQALRVVMDALGDPDPVVRRAAATALGEARSARAVDALSQALSDPEVGVRVETVRALGAIDDDSVLPPLISALKDPGVGVQQAAAEMLARWRSPGVARRLAAALASPDLRRAVGSLLESIGAAAVEPLVEVIPRADRETAAAAGALLERIAGPEPFVRRLSSRVPEERLRAVETLGAMTGPGASDRLVGSLDDPDRAVRIRAAGLLGDLGDPRAAESLTRAFLNDPVPEVSAAAEEALRRLGGIPPARPAEAGPALADPAANEWSSRPADPEGAGPEAS